ncbi:hypothetical protein [Desulfovermiculus halophilus]|jgi:hypothetical protein|uniref:hypothetical protein n=1 Tax=Desulfovermiculus halophilus TaxID=339722 RepID=UPI00048111D7|nr:hypothetical protein [Desulfovermiculus halophilus]
MSFPGLPIHDVDKTYLLNLIKRLKILYCVDVLGFAIMGNLFHLVVTMRPKDEISDDEVKESFQRRYGDEYSLMTGRFPFTARSGRPFPNTSRRLSRVSPGKPMPESSALGSSSARDSRSSGKSYSLSESESRRGFRGWSRFIP